MVATTPLTRWKTDWTPQKQPPAKTAVCLPGALANGGQVALWVFRELAWVNLARVLAAVLLVYAMGTPVGRRWAVR